jgi:tetratricopeptide (TPR) repeat protein
MMTVEIEALIRFGQWDQVLQIPDFPDFLPISRALRHYARACALGAQNKLEEAAREQQAFKLAAAAVPESARMAQNPAHTILDLADHTLTGELAYRRGNTSDAVSELTKAVAIEDDLRYMEPPDWFQPVRHSLGAILLADGRVDDAEKVYRADLERWPENGWSLYGLSRCLDQKKSPEAAAVKARFDKAWSQADTKLTATCLCVPASQPSPK